MKIQALQRAFPVSFGDKTAKSNLKSDNDKNPIKKGYERIDLLKATAIGGIAFGARCLWYLTDEGTQLDKLIDIGIDVAKKNKRPIFKKIPALVYIGAPVALMGLFIGAVAFLYTLYNSPKAMYQGKINAFKKQKDMDLYIKGNKVEKELYNQMNEKAVNASFEEKEKLKIQYAKLKAAKNEVPDFVKNQ